MLFFDRAPVHLSVHTLAAQGCQYHTDWTLIDILVHPIYEHSDEESKIFALRYIMVISHTYVNRQLNIGMIVGFDMSLLFTHDKPLSFSTLFDNLLEKNLKIKFIAYVLQRNY